MDVNKHKTNKHEIKDFYEKKTDDIDSDIGAKKKRHINRGTSTTRRIILGFLAAIIIGTVLLSLPVSTSDGSVDVMTSLFTATTSVCVTGLVVVDTFSHWSLFGKIIILMMIQLGGLGVVVFTSSLLLVFGRKVTLKDRITIQDAFNLNNMKGMVVFIKKVVIGTFIVEGIGACLYMIAFIPRFGVARGIWYAVFNSISAFCNAGMDIVGPNSLIDFNTSPLVILTTALLVFLGGLGFVVWFEVLDLLKQIRKKEVALGDFWKKLSVHCKIVLSTTAFLIVFAWIAVLLIEYNNPETIGTMSFGNKLLNSFFQSITFRTAGFASVNQAGLKDSTVLLAVIWMIIGGSPAGTAGGVKTVTAAVIMYTIISVVQGRKETIAFNKSINPMLVRRVLSVTFISILGFVVMSIALMVTNDTGITDTIYETASAIGTVGLSRGITSSLNNIGKLILIIGMYLGRIGPISMFVAFNNKSSVKNTIHYAEADIIVG
jgi:trk system potassium uptake protein TrkH